MLISVLLQLRLLVPADVTVVTFVVALFVAFLCVSRSVVTDVASMFLSTHYIVTIFLYFWF